VVAVADYRNAPCNSRQTHLISAQRSDGVFLLESD
jgi:hypothetical protein